MYVMISAVLSCDYLNTHGSKIKWVVCVCVGLHVHECVCVYMCGPGDKCR